MTPEEYMADRILNQLGLPALGSYGVREGQSHEDARQAAKSRDEFLAETLRRYRAAALEEAAKIAEDTSVPTFWVEDKGVTVTMPSHAAEIAAAIRERAKQ